jgi:hypothetical protein
MERRGTRERLKLWGEDIGLIRRKIRRQKRRRHMTVVLEISMSLDGYVTAAGVRPEEPMGDCGQQLHEWAFGADERGREVQAESVRKVGRASPAVAPTTCPCHGGVRTDRAAKLAHRRSSCPTARPGTYPGGSVYTFASSPIEALELAAAAAGYKDVDVFSASIGQQLLRAGRIDEIQVHLVPVLFGAGTRLFEDLGGTHVQLEIIGVGEGSKATHLRCAVVAAP